jgi:ATP-binding cassette subfamily B protein
LDATTDAWRSIPAPRRDEVARRLEPGEPLLACFEPDLETGLRYAQGLVLLTDRRILSGHPEGPADGELAWRSWPLDQVMSLKAGERSGLGQIELLGSEGRLDHWRYTAARAKEAHRLAHRFESFRRDGRLDADERAVTVCPGCGAVLPADQAECPACAAPPSAAQAGSALARLIPFTRPRAGMIALGFLLTLASTTAGLIPPYLTQPLVDDVLIPRQARGDVVRFGLVWWYLGLMVAASFAAWLLSWARTYVMALVSERIASDLRTRTYRHLVGLSVEFFGGRRTGDLMSRIGSDTDRINNFLSVNVVDFAADCLMIVGTAAVLVVKAPLLAAATLIPLPLALWLVSSVRRHLRHGFDAGNRAWAAMTSVLADTIPGIRVVKAFAQERREVERFARADGNVVRLNDRVNTVWSFFGPLLGLMTQVGLILVWAVGAWMVFYGGFQVGVLTMFLTYLGRFYTRLESMSRMVQATQRTAASAQRIFEILDRSPSVPEPTRPVHPGRLRGDVELRGVDFRYGTRKVLHDVDLAIRPGEMIGLVGATGAGKSTLVNLICRFYDVNSGSILVDGVDIRRFPVEEYRKNVGIVLQEPFLFFGTVAENIAYGRPDADRSEIIAAARAAKAHEFILRLPDGYDTPVGERGQSLSGGERQRISIARALLIDPAILILDEATSSVDTQTEREIQEALDNLTRGRTTIAIAHRLSTLCKADRIVVLDHGRIVEVGRHTDLLNQPDGAFARLHKAQLELAALGTPAD